jgi:hypothetical protein
VKSASDYQQFAALPSDETIRIGWPTPNHFLFDAPGKFFARTRINPDYGKPGWTRDCGKRLHRGCDIAPIHVTAMGKTTRVVFTDCSTGRDFESDEPDLVPHDDVFCVFEGVIAEVVTDETASNFGKHVVVEHTWPQSGGRFFTLYAHLAEISIQQSPFDRTQGRAVSGQRIGKMGQTSRSADARRWMAIAPHLHFEARNADGQSYNPLEFLRAFLR